MVPHATTADFVLDAIVPRVNAFRDLQDTTGRIVGNKGVAQALLKSLRGPVRTAHSMVDTPAAHVAAFEADIDRWVDQGLDTVPQFDHTLAAYEPPADGAPTFFIAPQVAPNGPPTRGYRLECFLAYREEPVELARVSARMPHPKNRCQSCRFLAGSAGFSRGNCIVVFPENVAAKEKVTSQRFALFFLNKFQRIYLQETIPRVQRLFGEGGWSSAQLSAADCYRARCIWSYLHDYFHHCGPRPLDTNLQVKMNFFVGLLEELKVDCQSAVTAYSGVTPFPREIVEFVVFERMFRYPVQPDAPTNFDAGTGCFLFEWLLKNRFGLREVANRLVIDLDGCVEGMMVLANEIEAIEATVEETAYRRLAKEFVRTLLPTGVNGVRFAVPDGYTRLTQHAVTETPLLVFSDLPY